MYGIYRDFVWDTYNMFQPFLRFYMVKQTITIKADYIKFQPFLRFYHIPLMLLLLLRAVRRFNPS